MEEDEDRKSPWNYHRCVSQREEYHSKDVSTMLHILREVHRTPKTDSFCHTDLELYKCDQCDFETCISVFLKNHVDMTHNNLQVDHKLANLLQGYFCKDCKLNTFSIFVLAKHDCKKSTIDNRKLEFSRKNSLGAHVLYSHTPNNKIKWFQCPHCPHKCKVKASLRIHILRKHTLEDKIEWIKCEHCPYKCKVKASLKTHILRKHTLEDKIEWVKCAYCSYKCREKRNLKGHIFHKHTLEDKIKWFKCGHCPYKCKARGHLKSHILHKHTLEDKIEWIQCGYCPFKCKEKGNLKKHVINKHTLEDEIKWFKCGQCPFKCKVKASLKRHIINKHTLDDKIDNKNPQISVPTPTTIILQSILRKLWR